MKSTPQTRFGLSSLWLMPVVTALGALACLAVAGCEQKSDPSPSQDRPSRPKETREMPDGKHLFILSGQSNMARFKPEGSFIPDVQEEFGKENVIVIKDAQGGRAIREWYRDWKPVQGPAPEQTGQLYDRLMEKVRTAIAEQTIASVTFLWMQGEKDARESHGDVYKASLLGLVRQVQADLGRDDVHVVIGRLSDFDMDNQRYPHWTKIRKVQEELCREQSGWAMVDTDDLNGVEDGLHYTESGYETFGHRLAQAAIHLIVSDSRAR